MAVAYIRCQKVERRSLVRRDIIMKQGGVRPHRLHWVEDRRKHFIVNTNQLERFLRGFRRLRGDGSNPVTDVANPVPAEDGKV